MNSRTVLALGILLLAAACITPTPPIDTPISPTDTPAPPTDTPEPGEGDFYVSRNGDNSDGRSWGAAWNELDQIKWSIVPSGSTVLIDGGSVACESPVTVTGQSAYPGDCGMVYESALTPRSGATIRLGTSGTVVIFGGRSTPLPYCGQSGYGAGNGRSKGIIFGDVSNVVLDGMKWGGIMVYGHGGSSVDFSRNSQDILVRNIEVFDNGTVGSRPNRPGVDFSGTRVTFERSLVHDNGADSFQSGGGVHDFTLRESWVYNLRPHPTDANHAFNHCTHTDGIQIWGGGVQSGVLVEDSIVGPGFTQGTILGNPGPADTQKATINDVTIRNSLFFKSTNNNIMTLAFGSPSGWVFENVTSFRGEGEEWWNIWVEGSGHIVRDSVFYGGRAVGINASGSGNCSYKVQDGPGANIDPQFADVNEDDWFSLDDFMVQNVACVGSSITSVADLLNR